LSPRLIRERASRVLELALAGGSAFRVHSERLSAVAERVVRATREAYPDGNVPFHSRWEHFRAGGVDRVALLDQALEAFSVREKARAKMDLAIVSVLLDAGAGADWAFHEADGGRYDRSEGLAVASFHLFRDGALSSIPHQALRVDAEALEAVDEALLARAFQVSARNPLIGVEGRVGLLRSLGRSCRLHPEFFRATDGSIRPGNLIDHWFSLARGATLPAAELLRTVLLGLSDAWPPRLRVHGVAFGDVWSHPALGPEGSFESWVPFHKLSQWLTYSLIEPAQEAGLTIERIDELTGLPEYRNGGLLIDSGVLELRDPAQARAAHRPDSLLVIEWRALTVALLDQVADRVRQALGKTPEELPLARVLQGGTWAAGRSIARELRADGSPPLKIESDGTVF
jgi:hypothetical protein